MQDEIDVQFMIDQVDAPGRVFAHGRPRAAVAAHIAGVNGLLLFGCFGEQQLDVIVTAQAGEAFQLGAFEGDAAHAWGEVGNPQYLQAALADFVIDAVDGVTHGGSPWQGRPARRRWPWQYR